MRMSPERRFDVMKAIEATAERTRSRIRRDRGWFGWVRRRDAEAAVALGVHETYVAVMKAQQVELGAAPAGLNLPPLPPPPELDPGVDL